MRYLRHKKGTGILLGKYTANLTKCDDFPLILSPLLAKKIFFLPQYAIYDTSSENNQFSPSFRRVSKHSAVSAALPEINWQPLPALHSSTTRGPCLPSHSKTICYEELTLASLQSAYRSMMYRGWACGSCCRQDPQTPRFQWYGQRMFQNITKIPQMVQVNF